MCSVNGLLSTFNDQCVINTCINVVQVIKIQRTVLYFDVVLAVIIQRIDVRKKFGLSELKKKNLRNLFFH